MNSAKTLSGVIEDVDELLDSILLSGMTSGVAIDCEDIEKLIDACEDIGLDFATEKLKIISKEINRKRNSLEYNSSKLIENYYVLNGYLNIVKSK